MSSMRRMSFRKTEKEKNAENLYKIVFIHLLDNNQEPLEIEIEEDMNGLDLLDKVFSLLGDVLQKDYFGLRYVYRGKEKRWLDGPRKVYHQIKKAKTTTLSLRVKHYPCNPVDDVVQDIVRYFLYLQLRRDLFSGNILLKGEALSRLIALVIQAEHSDLVEPTKEVVLELVDNLVIVENVSNNMAEEVCNIIGSLNGVDGKDAEKQFAVTVSQLESYGVEPYAVTDQTGEKLFLAMNHQGICAFSGEKRKHIYYWENISKMMFIKKAFSIEINIDNRKKRLSYKFSSEPVAKEFWKWALDRQYFMTLNNSSEAKKVKSSNTIFSKKTTHIFSGKSLKELTASCNTLNTIPQPPIVRTRNSALTRSNSYKATCRHSVNFESNDSKADLYATMPRGSRANKDISILDMGFENNGDGDKSELVTSTTSEESMLITSEPVDGRVAGQKELPIIIEDRSIDEIIESKESHLVQACFADIQESEEETELRKRDCDTDRKLMNGSLGDQYTLINNDSSSNGSGSDLYDNYRSHTVDGVFFVKFVIVTASILLLVMLTSLGVYYYYRSQSIADFNKQKYSSEWNKNIDLESIKRFVLRNDAP